MRAPALALSAFLACNLSCSGESTAPPADAGILDAGPADAAMADSGVTDAAPDAGLLDTGLADTGSVLDAGLPDAGGPAPGFGAISGLCGELDDELTSPDPSAFDNAIDFDMGYVMANLSELSAGGQTIVMEGTAGGSSELSEVFSFEVLHRCEGATLIKTETKVEYFPVESKKTDILVEIDGLRIGVSVVRAVGFPRDAPYTVERSVDLLTDKMSDILVSSANVVAADAWTKQILHVIAYGPMHAQSILDAHSMVAPEIRADTILWVTVSNGDDAFLYDN